jgi:hypothetical protein
MVDKTKIKQKEIRIQKPAQSLTAFQARVASGADERSGLLRGFVITCVALLVLIGGLFVWRMWRTSRIERHETALAALVFEVNGDAASIATNPAAASPAAEGREQRLRDAVPRLETLAAKAPGSRRDVALGILSTWKLELEGAGGILPEPTDPWSRLRLAQRSIALGQAVDAYGMISALHKNAKPNQAWAQLYWASLMQIRQLEGNREQALRDYAEYRTIFKDKADLGAMDKALKAI